MKLTIEITGVPAEHEDSVTTAIQNTFKWVHEAIVCGSRSNRPEVRCDRQAGHDGPYCHNGQAVWPSPHEASVPDALIRNFNVGTEVIRRSDGAVFLIVGRDAEESTVRLAHSNGEVVDEKPNASFWATYYARPIQVTAPTLTIGKADD